jgi:hypothetical protein
MDGMSQKAMEGGATMVRMDGMSQKAMEGGATMYRMCGLIFVCSLDAKLFC